MGFFSAIKKFFGQEKEEDLEVSREPGTEAGEAGIPSVPEREEPELAPVAAETIPESTAECMQIEEAPEGKSRKDEINGNLSFAKEEKEQNELPAEAIDAHEQVEAGENISEGESVQTILDDSRVAAILPDVVPEGKDVYAEAGPGEEFAPEPESGTATAETQMPDSGKTGTVAMENISPEDEAMLARLREAEPRLSAWLAIILDGVDEAGDELWKRLGFLLRSLQAPPEEADAFITDFAKWLDRMEYVYVDEFRSELQYRLALALDLEDEEDERNRLFVKLSDGLARTREQLGRHLDNLFSKHGQLDDAFWEEMEELFIMADLGYETSVKLVERLRERARKDKVTQVADARGLLLAELEEIFRQPRRIKAVNRPEVILMIGVNGVGKTTTIAKLAHRERMNGKKTLIVAADTFRAAAIEQLQVWAERVGSDFFAKKQGSDPASVAWEAMEYARNHDIDTVFIDTAGRLQTKVNLMEELGKIRNVLGKKHPGAPHRSILVLDATTGQNALSQAKLFKDSAGVDELILTKLDGTAKGGVAIAVAMQESLPITFVGLGEKMEDLRPFNGDDYARALLGETA